MGFFRSVIAAFSMFSKLPTPRISWDKVNMRHILTAFPLVGAVIGALVFLCAWLCTLINASAFLFGAVLTLIPVLITGGIHLDGFMDTLDALASHASPEKKREILKDPRAGAFAVIGACIYFILYFALCAELHSASTSAIWLLALTPVYSRCVSGICSQLFPSQGTDGSLDTFRGASKRSVSLTVLFVLFALLTGAAVYISLWGGIAVFVCALICAVYVYFMSKAQFGGMSGDISGFLLTLCELAFLACVTIIVKVGVI